MALTPIQFTYDLTAATTPIGNVMDNAGASATPENNTGTENEVAETTQGDHAHEFFVSEAITGLRRIIINEGSTVYATGWVWLEDTTDRVYVSGSVAEAMAARYHAIAVASAVTDVAAHATTLAAIPSVVDIEAALLNEEMGSS